MTSRCLAVFVITICFGANTFAVLDWSIYLDADTPATGSNLGSVPLVVAFGSIEFNGSFTSDLQNELEFLAAGASGRAFCAHRGEPGGQANAAELSFDFDVESLTFIYGGNTGSITIEARDAQGTVLDSFYQANTYYGQPAGPITMSGSAIRSLHWWDSPGRSFCVLDNITIVVPEPATLLLFGLGGMGLLRKRCNKERK